MLKINKKIEYALIALKHMAIKDLKDKSSLTTAREISDLYKTPFDTTAKIMQSLNNAGVLSSNQGVKGGYQLTKNLKEINYIEFAEIIEKKKFEFSCEGPKGICDLFDCCNIKTPLQAMNLKLKEFFLNVSLYDLLLFDEQSKNCSEVRAFEQINTNEGSHEL